MKIKYHLCCNQFKGCWEVRDEQEKVLFSGSLSESEYYLEKINLK
ncbi:hypothetical protein [Clostridium sulfidigenes]